MREKLIESLGEEVGVDLPEVRITGVEPAVPSVFPVATAAAVSVGAVTAAAALYWTRYGAPATQARDVAETAEGRGSAEAATTPEVSVDVRHAVAAFMSERYFQIDGAGIGLWAPLSGDYRTSDGWVRLHCNFDHHRDAALRALELPTDADRADVSRACESRTSAEIEDAVIREGGCAAAMRGREEWLAHPQAEVVAGSPLVALSRIGAAPARAGTLRNRLSPDTIGADRALSVADTIGADRALPVSDVTAAGRALSHRCAFEAAATDSAAPEGLPWGSALPAPVPSSAAGRAGRPLEGVRVLDLTRVIAGPVAARILAAHGADVLHVGAAHLPEVPGLVLETAFGKRSCHIDLRTEAETLRELVRRADVVIQAYRPGSLDARGFGPEDLAELRPGVVCVEISAYGSRGPWGRRRGFDSLVQMACGIAHDGGDGARPRPLPCQALDHATGYLAAFGAVAGLLRRGDEGGSWRVELSLARTARWLDGLGRSAGGEASHAPHRMDDLLERMASSFGVLTYVRPPGRIEGAEPRWASPPPRPGEHPAGWATATG
ncbi:CoA transferase [Microtetraspora niveoalba]|uniref:CoA transferase n=1 Tax=Microtetraspora niveoalba TaxID=46175 RepID=UPI001FE0B781|nr:CoA transferase [Microtetraspora niveoalba]